MLKLRGERNRTFTELSLSGEHNLVDLEDCHDITFRGGVWLNAGLYAVVLYRCSNIRFLGTVQHGAGMEPGAWAAHDADSFLVKECSGAMEWIGCDIARAAHDAFTVLDSPDASFLWEGNTFGVTQPRYDGTDLRPNGGSFFTYKRNNGKARWLRNYFYGAPDGQHVAPHADGGYYHHAAIQLSGTGCEIIGNVIVKCAKGLMLSSGPGQVLKDCVIRGNIIKECATYPEPPPSAHSGKAIEIQGGGGRGSITGNKIIGNTLWNAQEWIHFAMEGMGADLEGNEIRDNAFGGEGRFFSTAGGAARAEEINSRFPSVCSGNRSISISPPTNGPPPPPLGYDEPALEIVTPNHGQVGDVVRLIGQRFRETPLRVIFGPSDAGLAGAIRSWSDTLVTVAVPIGAQSGSVYLRRFDGKPSNALPFTVVDEPPPPPPAGLSLTGYTATQAVAAVAAGAEFGLVGQGLDIAGLQVRWNAHALELLAAGPLTARVRAPAANGKPPAPVELIAGEQRATGPLLVVTPGGDPPPPPPDGATLVTLDPVQGARGSIVTLTGAGFGVALGVVTFGGHLARVNVWRPDRIQCYVPASAPAGIVPVIVQSTDGRRSNELPFTVEGADDPNDPAAEVISRTNALRAVNGIAPVVANDLLRRAAQDYADLCAPLGHFSHTGPDGSTPWERIQRAGYPFAAAGENIARGFSTPESVMRAWAESPGHRSNLLNAAFTEIGVGVRDGIGGKLWDQNFARPR